MQKNFTLGLKTSTKKKLIFSAKLQNIILNSKLARKSVKSF